MSKIWLVAMATYWRRVRTGSFLVLTLGLPVFMVIAGAIPFWLAARMQTLATLGIVDQTGRLGVMTTLPVAEQEVTLRAFADLDAAKRALLGGAIDAFLVIPPTYFAGRPPSFYGPEAPNDQWQAILAHLLRQAQRPTAPAWLLARLDTPSQLTYVDFTTGATVPQGSALLLRIFFPSGLAVLFALLVFSSVGQMGSAMVREKEQRALEMIITSLAPRELVAGKVLGMSFVSLTQLGIWALGAVAAIGLAFANELSLTGLSLPWSALLWAMLLGAPGYLLYAVLSAGLGLMAGDNQQAQQLAGLLGFFGLAPLWLLGLVVNAPDGRWAVALTLFPLTAPMLGLFRMSLTTVPRWQLVTALLLLLVSLLVAIWFVGRIFRIIMLLYGQRLRPRQLWQAWRST